ncbi:hypothetical protein [Actinophytocola sp.]|uniref:hypothetical protein n=1 Tax=Actinophytocola sp. TaxID=1872138 RepID=UPI002D7EEBA3|nr:hypothetical protein [Actinophytocola sp.]HET9141667.1 hypothetical protein [Actinophytocola sp.]HEU5110784.1 hypothetical protein [Micromonosporaceae bacterium]
MTTSDNIDRVLRALRSDIAALENRIRYLHTDWRRGAAACGLAGTILALTVAPWVSRENGRDPHNLWQLAEDRPLALATLALILLFGLLTFNLTDSRLFHGIMAGVGGLAAVGVMFAGAGSDSDYTAATGRWLMFFALLGLVTVHAGWAAQQET